jgi:HD-GYP domain-containing protein (c-di-GMP phosphodiesterase class II)
MKLPQDKIEGTRIASLVHDIGKVNLPTEIVSWPGKLIDVEFNLIKNHPRVGYDILKKVDFPWPIAEIVFQHQEKIDGSGYPRGLKSNEICIEAKILGVANVVEAMSSYKSYRPALSIDEALAEISNNKNILFDPEIVDTCNKLFKEKGFKFK